MARKRPELSLMDETLENCRRDRLQAQTLLSQLMICLIEDKTLHQSNGLIAAKYLETLQRSNEQMVKVALALKKVDFEEEQLSSEDKEELLDTIKEEKAEVLEK